MPYDVIPILGHISCVVCVCVCVCVCVLCVCCVHPGMQPLLCCVLCVCVCVLCVHPGMRPLLFAQDLAEVIESETESSEVNSGLVKE